MVGAFFMPGEICAFFMPIFTERAEQANTALANGDISQEQYDALQREIIETEQDLKKLETQANQSATAMQKIAATGEKLKTTGDNISSAGQKLLPVTAAVTGMGAASLKTAADFESSMSQVQATMGITKDSMSTVDGQSVNTMMTIVPKISGAITAVKTAFAALNVTVLANPIVLIIAAITALVAAFIYLWNTNEGSLKGVWISSPLPR